MHKTLLLSMLFAMSSVSAVAAMPVCPDAVKDQSVPCRPTATTQILPVCPDAIDEQTEACKPTPTTQIKSEVRCIDDDGNAWTKDEVARGKGNFAKHGSEKCWSEGESTGYSMSGKMPHDSSVGESHGYSHGVSHTESSGESVSRGEGASCSCEGASGESHASGSGVENA